MKFFKRLLGIKTNNKDVDQNLFLDNNPPMTTLEEQEQIEQINIDRNKLLQFEDRNYFFILGQQLGFQEGNYVVHDKRIKAIKADFTRTVDVEMEKLSNKKFEVKSLILENKGISTLLEEQYHLKLEQLEAKLQELEEAKALSVDDEGLVMISLHAFQEGFVSGIQLKNKETKILTPTKIYA